MSYFASKVILFPYYISLKIRHFLYDKGIKKSKSYPIKIISIGNITVGGTGKTPHCEMLIRKLVEKYDIYLLSRGYKRKTKGFRIVSENDTFDLCGDEPLQIKQKFPNITVAVCENRCIGTEKLIELHSANKNSKEQLIILDDAFQHRRIIAKHSIVLVNFNNPTSEDNLLPIGTLRDLPCRLRHANTIIISNYPYRNEPNDDDMSCEKLLEYFNEQSKIWRKKLSLKPEQNLFFSAIKYLEPIPVFKDVADKRYLYSKSALVFSGIANNNGFKNYLSGLYKIDDIIKFSDHKNFTKGDMKLINMLGEKYQRSIIITTEKDSKRLLESKYLTQESKKRLFYIPIEVDIIPEQLQEKFTQIIQN